VHIESIMLQGFELARAEFDVPGAKLVRITEQYYDAAVDCAEKYFTTQEPLNKYIFVEMFQF